MTTVIVSSGTTVIAETLLSGDTTVVLSSGTSELTSVTSGGRLIVSSGGVSDSDTVFEGGVEVLLLGASGSGLTVSAGGVLTGAGVLSGVTTDLGLVSGVTIVSATGGGFGSLTVGSHGIASGVTIDDAFALIQSGGTARDLLAIDGGFLIVSAGGTTTGTILSSGSAETVFGIAHDTIISASASQSVVAGGEAGAAVVLNGGLEVISSGGASFGADILQGGSQTLSGGRTVGTNLANGGLETVSSGGVAQSSLIGSNSVEDVLSGGLASGFAISSGGNLTVTSGGVLKVGTTGTNTNFGQIDILSTGEMDLAGALQNGGVITYENSNVVKVTAAKATLTGSGVIRMDNNVLITGSAASDVLDNESDTIEGTGQLGGEHLTLINRGTIDANLAGGLNLNAVLVTNTGLIEATDAATLEVFAPVKNSGGVIDAKGASIDLEAGAIISGGVLSGSAAGGLEGEFFVAGPVDDGTEFDGTGQAVTNKALVNIGDGTQLTLAGAFDNAGEISMSGAADPTDLVLDGATVTLTGSGTILMSDNINNRIFGDATTFTNVLDNVDNTIEGAGEIGFNIAINSATLSLVNGGTIDATGVGASLEIDTTSATNTGLMEADGTAGLIFETTVNNSGGVIAANQGNVSLETSTQILGGVLSSTFLTEIRVTDTASGGVTLNGSASPLTNAGDVDVLDSNQLDLVGAIVNENEISLNAGADATDLVVGGTSATLTGGGVIELSDSASNRIYGAVAADKLINVDNTIEGAGLLGNGQLTLVNSGTIDSNEVSNSLILNATSTVNTGLLGRRTPHCLSRASSGIPAA